MTGTIRTRTRGTAAGGKSRAPKAAPRTPLQQYQDRAARAFSVPRLDMDTALILDAALNTCQPPQEIAAHLGLPVAAVENTLFTAIITIGRILDLSADAGADATVSPDA